MFEHLREWDVKLTAQRRQQCLLLSGWHAGRELCGKYEAFLHLLQSCNHIAQRQDQEGVSFYTLWRMRCILPDLVLPMQQGKCQPQEAQNEQMKHSPLGSAYTGQWVVFLLSVMWKITACTVDAQGAVSQDDAETHQIGCVSYPGLFVPQIWCLHQPQYCKCWHSVY